MQSSASVPNNLIPRLEHYLTTIRREIQYQHRKHEGLRSPKRLLGQTPPIYRGLYRGVYFALVSQVPALALFLSTYDATKHTLGHLARSANLNIFDLHNIETHLFSGMVAKAAGSLIWTPMNRLQSVGQAPMTLKEACKVANRICRTEGIFGLWSGYLKTYSTLLPYTMIYFATYEQLKLLARWMVSPKAGQHERGNDDWNTWTALQEYCSDWKQQSQAAKSTALTLDMYMMCVASSVVVSSAICQTASTMRSTAWEWYQPKSSKAGSSYASSLPNLVAAIRRQPPVPTNMVVASSGTRFQPVFPAQFKTLMSSSFTIANQTLTCLPWQQSQHAIGRIHTGSSFSWQPMALHQSSLPSTINQHYQAGQSYKPGHFMSTIMTPVTSTSLNDNERRNVATNSGRTGLLRTIARGLGSRILWTVPGVTLTTAGFEFLRNTALGS